MVKNTFSLVVVLLFAFIAGLPILHEGLPPTHDGEYHVVRFHEFDQTLRDGNWYPRWAADLNNGYGVPLFNYVYPLPNYVASFFHFLGFSFIDSFKLNMFFALILGSIFFYLWAKEFWGRMGGIVGAIFYTYSPYHFLDVYIRGSVGEVWALAFFPAFLWSITKFIKHQQLIFFISSSIFLSLIIFSHNILALMFFPFALSYYGFLLLGDKGNKGGWGKGIFVFLLGIGLSAIFWIPAILERQYVTGLEIFDVSAHFPNLYQLLIPSWGSGFSGENTGNQMSFQIGIANLTVVLLSLLSVIFIFVFRHSGNQASPEQSRISNGSETLPAGRQGFWTRRVPDGNPSSQNDGKTAIIFFFLVWFFLIVFLMLKISLPIWQTVPFINYFQFPWRFLSLEILVASFLAGSVVYFWKSKLLAILLIFLSFILGVGYSKPAYYHSRDDNYYLTRSNFIDGTNSPGNVFNTIWFDKGLKKEKEKLQFASGKGKVEAKLIKATSYKFIIEANTDSIIQINTAYFPGWSIFVDGKEIRLDKTEMGIGSFIINEGRHAVNIEFKNTFARNIASLITGGSLLLLLTLLVFGRMKR